MVVGDHAKPKTEGIRLSRAIIALVIIVCVVLGLSFLLRTFVYQAYAIPSGSMETTIMTNDMVFTEKISYRMHEPEAGDIVTFDDPADPARTLIKRVIATEGQVVDLADGYVYVDGVRLTEPYTNALPSYPLSSRITYPYEVPDDMLWVMGDNRTNSSDSRAFGAIPVSSVTGKAVFTIWPLDRIGGF